MPRKRITVKPGEVYGGWTIIGMTGEKKHAVPQVICQCTCGKIEERGLHRLASGKSRGCRSCINPRTHGEARGKMTPEYLAWRDMHRRCRDKRPKIRKNYADRGIGVCAEWADYATFLNDMGRMPAPGYTLDRIDNDQGYRSGNCRWATQFEQSRNTRKNLWLTYNGRTMIITDWAREIGLAPSVLVRRFHSGLPAEEILWPGNLKHKP